jgi:SHS2 domain-containing protein
LNRKYRLIEHTADVGLIAYGQTLAEAFANAAYGMFSIMADLRRVKEVDSRPVEVSAVDSESLLFDWLNSLLYFFDAEQLLFRRFDILTFSDTKLKAACYGEKADPARHHLKVGVKSATYHMLTVDRQKNRVKVIFDI